MIIGKFTSNEDNIHGFIQTLSGDPHTNGADYKVSTDNGCEIGAGWKKTSKDGKAYVSVRLDSPFLWAPINCAMFGNKDGSHSLVWQRGEA